MISKKAPKDDATAMKTVEQLVEDALEEFNDDNVTVTSQVRKAIRIASKRQDYVSLVRLYLETFDFTVGKVVHSKGLTDARQNLTNLVGEEQSKKIQTSAFERYMKDHKDIASDDVYAKSIGQIEELNQQYNEMIDWYNNQPLDGFTQIDAYFVADKHDKAAAQLIPLRQTTQEILQRVQQMVYDFLIETEQQLEFGQKRPNVFERAHEYIERSLRTHAPDALEKFEAAEEALSRGGPEDLSQCLTSCRRMIKAVADALYPATGEVITGEDGREREMTEDAYRNRLLQFALNKLGSTHNSLVKETMRSLGTRLDRLISLSSKGVHREVHWLEAESCMTWTYLTVAEFLRIADGTWKSQQESPFSREDLHPLSSSQ